MKQLRRKGNENESGENYYIYIRNDNNNNNNQTDGDDGLMARTCVNVVFTSSFKFMPVKIKWNKFK